MWNRLLGINSFIFWPASFIFMLYAMGRTILMWEWKLLVIAIVVFGLFSIVEVVLGIISES